MLIALLPAALATGIDLSDLVNSPVLSSQADAICMGQSATASAARTLSIPIGQSSNWLAVDTVMSGPSNIGPRALKGHLRFEDGEALELHAWIGHQVSPFPTSSEDSQAIALTHEAGHSVHGQKWRIATGRPGVDIEEMVLELTLPNHRLCITSIELASDPPPQQTDTSDWYTWVAQPSLRPPPQLVPVEGAANRAIHLGEDGHLRYPDGTRARFWGVNLTGRSAIPPKEEAEKVAQQLARLGFNAARIHHIDSSHGQLVNPRRHLPGEPVLLPDRLDDLDFFIAKLKEAGIYLFLEIATLRELGTKDGLPASGALPGGHKLATMFRPRWTQAYLEAFETLWGRVNPYTGLAYSEEPAVALLELSNEHSLLANWGGGIEALHQSHLRILDQLWNRWLLERYGDNATLRAAWAGSSAHGGLMRGESLEDESVRREPLHPGLRHAYPHKRLMDLNQFYSKLESEFYEAVSEKAKQLGFSQPVVASMSFGRPQLQHIYGGWDAADMHLEWDQTRRRRLLSNQSALSNPRTHRLMESPAFAVEGQSFVVTELNHPFPNQFMAEAPLLWASIASVQDWDAIIWFEWLVDSSEDRDNFVHSQFDLSHATVKTAQMPTASSLFRSQILSPADGRFTVHRPLESARLQTLLGKTALPWKMGDPNFLFRHQIRTSLNDSPTPDTPGPENQEVTWSEEEGRLTLNLPSLQAQVGKHPLELPHLRGQLDSWAAISLMSTDGLPLGSSHSALLTLATQQENTGMAWDLAKTVIRAWGVAPIRIAPLRGQLEFQWPQRPHVYALDQEGQVLREIPVKRRRGGWWRIQLDGNEATPWLQITSQEHSESDSEPSPS